MEATTPPNTPGFNRKPTRKNRKTFNCRKSSGYPKSLRSSLAEAPPEATAWLYGSMFLMIAAKLLAPMMELSTPSTAE